MAKSLLTSGESRQTASGSVTRRGHKYTFTFPRESGKNIANYTYDFSAHPLKHLLRGFFFSNWEEANSATLNGKSRAIWILGEFMLDTGVQDLNPEVFNNFIDWLVDVKNKKGETRFTEMSLAAYVNNVKLLYSSGIEQRHKGWSQRSLDLISETKIKRLRGRFHRAIQTSIDKAISHETFTDLVKALSIEFEECRRVLAERKADKRDSLYNLAFHDMRMIDPNPFIVFGLLAGIRLGLRSSEFNALCPEDIHVDGEGGRHELYAHAPDKEDDYIPIDDVILESLNFCEEWGREAREQATDAEREQFENILLVYRATNSCYKTSLFPMTTHHLNETHLRYFYRKYFNYKMKSEEGAERPLLHAVGDPSQPLWVPYRKIRNAFAVRLAEQEPDKNITQRALRHRNSRTTEIHYLNKNRLDRTKKTQLALKVEAQILTLRLKNRVEVGISDETIRRAEEAGAHTPQGLCGRAMEGLDCERAADCLECPFLVVIASRRPRFVTDREEYLLKAEKREDEGDDRVAENYRARAALCEAHIIRIDDQFGKGEE